MPAEIRASDATQNAQDEQKHPDDLHLVSYILRVRSLTVQAPPPGVPLPLPVPVELPPSIARRVLGPKSVQEPQLLLEDVSLECNPGEVLAIIGASGSGKSTLLNAIGRRTGGLKTLSGSVTIHPTSATRNKAADAIGFVPQDDLLLSCLTVRETLLFAAGGKSDAVDRTIEELGLQKAADTLVGGGSSRRKGISGGERRRLSIGCVLVRQPSVLILDEPTTGLDTTAAFSVLSLLSSLARRNRTVIMSIHQPRSDAYPLFDRLCLLSHGRVVYSGLRRDVLPWFASLGHACPPHTNPLDFLIDVSAVDARDEDAEKASQARVDRLLAAWAERERKEGGVSGGGSGEKGASGDVDVSPGKAWKSTRPGFAKQMVVLTDRAFKNVYRDHGLLLGFLLQVAVIGIMAGLTFYKPPETPAGIQTLKTVYYQGVVMFFYLSFILYIYIDCSTLVVFDREREDRLYDVLPWVCSQLLAFLPINIIVPTLYAIIIYFMCGFRHDNLAKNLWVFIGNCILQQHASFAYALLAAAADRNFAQASLIANGLSIMLFLSAGYLIVNLPAYIGWTKWMSPYFYGFRWTAITQFRGRYFACPGIEGVERNQCIGDNVLVGLRFNMHTPLWLYPIGIVAFFLVVMGLAVALLQYYHPGGVKHAKNKLSSRERHKKPARVEDAEALRRERVDVELRDMGIIVKGGLLAGSPRKTILQGVDVTFRPGRLTVVLGPSGAGKSSLLEAIAGQLPPSRCSVTGAIYFNGRPLASGHQEQVAFVQQSDGWLLPALTIRETLHYAAELQLRGMNKAAKRERAEEVMRAMGLAPVADHVVGGETVKGISGGEKRRLALAVQLLADPAVLLADEPTSGLDAFSALSVIDALRALARSGRTVVASVHQPRSEVWNQVDDVVLLAAGGRVVYAGEKAAVVGWVDGTRGVQMPDWWNPADWIVDAVCGDGHDVLVQAWQKDRELRKTEEDAPPAEEDLARARAHAVGVQKRGPSEYALPVVLSRSWKNLRRQQDVFVARMANPPFLALIFWLFFLRLGHGPAGAQDRIGLLMESSAMPFVGMLAAIAIYPAERDAFYREYKNPASRYGAATFLVSYTVQEIPMQFVAAMLYAVITMAGMGLQIDARRFFEFSFGVFGLINFGESIGIIFASWVTNGGLSVSLVSCALTVLAQTCGIISVTLPRWLAVIAWGSALTYQARVAFINEFSGLVFNCSEEQLASGECLAATGEQIIEQFGFKDRNTAKFTALLLVVLVIYRVLAYAAVRARVALL